MEKESNRIFHIAGNYIEKQEINISGGTNYINTPEDKSDKLQRETTSTVTAEHVVEAVKRCKGIFSTMASYAIAFCVCRDLFHMGNNVSAFERGLRENGIEITDGTINSAISRSGYMKLPIDKWRENGASERTLKLLDMFRKKMEEVLAL
jgi:hypothetical protein